MSKEIIQPGKYVALTYTIVDQAGDVVEQHDVPLGFVFGSDWVETMAAAASAVVAAKPPLVPIAFNICLTPSKPRARPARAAAR